MGDTMQQPELPAGWDEARVQRTLAHDEGQTDDEATAEDQGAFEIDLSNLPPITPDALSHLRMHVHGGGPVEPKFLIEEVSDPVAVARFQAQDERARRNEAWLQAHWSDLLPRARGRFIAVAGQEAFIADSQEEAWAKATAAHPDDDGVIEQYVRPERGPRLYAHQR
jgi:hypothetical protein